MKSKVKIQIYQIIKSKIIKALNNQRLRRKNISNKLLLNKKEGYELWLILTSILS